MHSNAGFTLVEALIAAAILISGLAASAVVFSYSVATNLRNQQRATATIMLCDKLEELRSSANWHPGPYHEHIPANGSLPAYLRTWMISGTIPATATVRILIPRLDDPAKYQELASGTITAGSSF